MKKYYETIALAIDKICRLFGIQLVLDESLNEVFCLWVCDKVFKGFSIPGNIC
jgi:hypothetical protein